MTEYFLHPQPPSIKKEHENHMKTMLKKSD